MSDYLMYRSMIKTGDLIEWASPAPIGRAIRAVTKKNVNHTSVAIWTQTVEKNHISAEHAKQEGPYRLYIGEAVSYGFALTFLSKALQSYKGQVYWSRLSPKHEDSRLGIAKHAQDLEGRGYDYLSLIRNLWRRVPLDATRPYCSEAVHIALIRAGLLDREFSPTGDPKQARCGLRPGEFDRTGLFLPPIRIL